MTTIDSKNISRIVLFLVLFISTTARSQEHNQSQPEVAKIIANDLIQVYLEDQLYNTRLKNRTAEPTVLNWTSSKTA